MWFTVSTYVRLRGHNKFASGSLAVVFQSIGIQLNHIALPVLATLDHLVCVFQ